MDESFFDSTKYEFLTDTYNNEHIRSISIRPVNPLKKCTQCSATETLVKRGNTSHTVLDIYEKEPIEVTITRERYRCKECDISFTTEGDPYTEKCHISQEFKKFVAQKIIQDSSLTYKAVGKMYGVSEQSIKDALSEHKKETEKLIISVQPCYRLIFLPFRYEKLNRCCVCGTDDSDRNVILDFIDDYSVKSIKKYLNTKVAAPSDIMTTFCALNPDVVALLHSETPNTEVAISPTSIMQHFEELSNDKGDNLYNMKVNSINSLKKILLKNSSSKYDDFCKNFTQWMTDVPAQLEKAFQELTSKISSCLQECFSATQYDENEYGISEVTDAISHFRKLNSPYGAMCYRILFQNEFMKDQLKASHLGSYMSFTTEYREFGIRNYAVDIKTLYKLTK